MCQTVKCDENQELRFGSSCEPQCNKFRGEKCPLLIAKQAFYKCACKPGFLRIEGDKCIDEDSFDCGGKYNLWKDFFEDYSTSV